VSRGASAPRHGSSGPAAPGARRAGVPGTRSGGPRVVDRRQALDVVVSRSARALGHRDPCGWIRLSGLLSARELSLRDARRARSFRQPGGTLSIEEDPIDSRAALDAPIRLAVTALMMSFPARPRRTSEPGPPTKTRRPRSPPVTTSPPRPPLPTGNPRMRSGPHPPVDPLERAEQISLAALTVRGESNPSGDAASPRLVRDVVHPWTFVVAVGPVVGAIDAVGPRAQPQLVEPQIEATVGLVVPVIDHARDVLRRGGVVLPGLPQPPVRGRVTAVAVRGRGLAFGLLGRDVKGLAPHELDALLGE